MDADRRSLRRLVLGLALVGPALVVCAANDDSPNETDPSAAYFFFGFGCDSEESEIRATPSGGDPDWLSDLIDPSEECSGQADRALIDGQVGDNPPFVDVFAEVRPSYGSYSVQLSATYLLSDAIPGGTVFSASEVQASVQYQETTGGGGPPVEIAFEADLALLGEPFGTSAADEFGEPFGTSAADAVSVTVQCEGDAVDVPVGGLPAILPLDLDFGTCTVTVSQVAEIFSAGEHIRMFSVRLKGSEFHCESDLQCLNNFAATYPICGSTGFCQDGDEGDPCWTDHDCDQTIDNYCGVDFLCLDGSDGDSCFLDDQCQPGLICEFEICTP